MEKDAVTADPVSELARIPPPRELCRIHPMLL